MKNPLTNEECLSAEERADRTVDAFLEWAESHHLKSHVPGEASVRFREFARATYAEYRYEVACFQLCGGNRWPEDRFQSDPEDE